MYPLYFLNERPQPHTNCRLRKQLQRVERRILRITGTKPDSWRWAHSQKKLEYVGLLIRKRKDLLNKMFVGTPEEVSRMEQVNEHLLDLTQRMYRRSAELYRNVLTTTYDKTFDVDVMVEGSLTYCCDCDESILGMTNDGYYGSDFRRMLSIIDLLYLYQCKGFEIKEIEQICKSMKLDDDQTMSNEELGFKDHLNDNKTWGKDTFMGCYSVFNHICICHAVHAICSHQPYSIPDLLRMNDFWCEVKVTHQYLVKQDGSRRNML